MRVDVAVTAGDYPKPGVFQTTGCTAFLVITFLVGDAKSATEDRI
jgi:hypothetical protein